MERTARSFGDKLSGLNSTRFGKGFPSLSVFLKMSFFLIVCIKPTHPTASFQFTLINKLLCLRHNLLSSSQSRRTCHKALLILINWQLKKIIYLQFYRIFKNLSQRKRMIIFQLFEMILKRTTFYYHFLILQFLLKFKCELTDLLSELRIC